MGKKRTHSADTSTATSEVRRNTLSCTSEKQEVAALQLLRGGVSIKEIAKALGVTEREAEAAANRVLMEFAYYSPDVADHSISRIIVNCSQVVEEIMMESLRATKLVLGVDGRPVIDSATNEPMTEPDVKMRLVAVNTYRQLKESTNKRSGAQVAVNIGIGQQQGGQHYSFESELRRVRSENKEDDTRNQEEVVDVETEGTTTVQ